jgi:hypothetical protein
MNWLVNRPSLARRELSTSSAAGQAKQSRACPLTGSCGCYPGKKGKGSGSVMGEARRKKSATQKFIAKHPEGCFCAGIRRACTREHMPPKAMFDGSHRPDKLVMPACDECNRRTRTADLTAAIVSRWGYLLSQKVKGRPPKARASNRKAGARTSERVG